MLLQATAAFAGGFFDLVLQQIFPIVLLVFITWVLWRTRRDDIKELKEDNQRLLAKVETLEEKFREMIATHLSESKAACDRATAAIEENTAALRRIPTYIRKPLNEETA